jgi:hypothetical protein
MAHERDHNQEHDVSNIRNVGGAHEHRDVNIRGVLMFLVVMTVGAIVVQLALFGMFRYLQGSATARDPEPNPMLAGQKTPTRENPIRDFPQPRLQTDAPTELERTRAAESRALNGPPVWLDEQNGVVRIPIDQAMQLTLARLPMQPLAAATKPQQPAPGAAKKK